MSIENKDSAPTSSSAKSRSTLKSLALWALYLLALIIVILALILAWGLGTQSGREWLAKTAVGVVNGGENLEVRVVNLKSPSLGLWTIDDIELYIENQKTFTGQKLELRWLPKELLAQQIHIEALVAERIDVYLNESKEKPKAEKETQPFSIPSLPYIKLEKFNFPNVNIHRAISSADNASTNAPSQTSLVKSLEKFTIKGNFLLPENQLLQLNLDASSEAKSPLTVSIKSTVSNNSEQQPQVTILGHLNENAGGDLGSLLQFPNKQPLKFGIDVTITPLGPSVLVDLKDFHFDISASTKSKKTHKIKLTSLAEINTESLTAIISELNLHINNTKHSGYGSWDGKLVQAALTLNKLPLEIVSIWHKPISSGYLSGELLINGTVANGTIKNLQWSADSNINTRYQTVPIATKFIAQGNQKTFKVKTLEVQSNQTKLAAKGIIDIEGNTNSITFSVAHLNTNLIKKLKLPVPPSIPLEKADLTIIKASGKISGKLNDPNVNTTLRIKGKYENEAFDGEAIIEKEGDAITIEKLWLANNDSQSSVSGTFNIQSLAAELNASVNDFPIRLLALTGINLPQNLHARVSSEATFKGYLTSEKIIGSDIRGKASATGSFDDIPFSLKANGSQSEKTTKLNSLILTAFDQKVLDVNGKYFEDIFTVNIIADKLPTKLLEALSMASVTGDFSANLKARGDINTLKESSSLSGTFSYTTEFTNINEDDKEETRKYQWASNIETVSQKTEQFPSSTKRLSIASKITQDGKDNGNINIALPLDTYLEALLKKKVCPA